MKLQLIHTESYLVAVDDSEIEDCYALTNSFKSKIIKVDKSNEEQWHQFNCNKITHHLPLNNAPVLEGVELLPSLEDDVEKLAWDFYWRRNPKIIIAESSRPDLVIGYVEGHNKAKEKYMFTEEDMRKSFQCGQQWVHEITNTEKEPVNFNDLIQSLSQQKLPTSFDTETTQYIYEV